MTEIEIHGPLEKIPPTILNLKTYTLKEYQEVVVFFKDIKNQDFRLKLQDNQKNFEFIHKTKKGHQRSIRQETWVKIDKKYLSEFLKILKILGIKSGYISSTKRIDIKNKFYIWSFKIGAVIGNYWELEATPHLIRKINNQQKIKEHLIKQAQKYNLKIWSDEEFKKARKKKWQNIKPIYIDKLLSNINI